MVKKQFKLFFWSVKKSFIEDEKTESIIKLKIYRRRRRKMLTACSHHRWTGSCHHREIRLSHCHGSSIKISIFQLCHMLLSFVERIPWKLLLCFLTEHFGCLGKEEFSTWAWACKGSKRWYRKHRKAARSWT